MKYTAHQQKRHRKELVNALRSGKYKQATGKLRITTGDFDKFCCLGVACDISGLGEWSKVLNSDQQNYLVGQFGVGTIDMPREVREYFGFTTGGGEFVVPSYIDEVGYDSYSINDVEDALFRMNDRGISFLDIAKTIAEEPKDLIMDEYYR